MATFKYLIVGGGMAAHAAVQGIRDVDAKGSIAVFGEERDPPYKRPPLSKGLWQGKPVESIWYKTAELGAELRLAQPIARVDPVARTVTDDGGAEHSYEKLLIATGARPRHLADSPEGVNYYRTVDDFRQLREDAERFEKFAVIGGGFIGSEVAAALAMNDRKVALIFPDDGISSRIFPAALSSNVTEYYREKGVQVLAGCPVQRVERRGDGYAVIAGETEVQEILVDRVVAGIGVEPNVELAKQAGLEAENGILVDEQLRTSAPDVFAAGDVAAFVNPALGSRMRVEHEDNAKVMGRTAGRNMAGEQQRYEHLPFFYSDLFELGYEAVGELDSRLETVADWKEPYREGVLYYLREGRVRGVLLWNVWEQVDAARRLIAEPGPFSADDLHGRLPEGTK
jgi:NADPH-dependent 2,4-dienoyl-CoA reductase/sulfur reductase-like enzyme